MFSARGALRRTWVASSALTMQRNGVEQTRRKERPPKSAQLHGHARRTRDAEMAAAGSMAAKSALAAATWIGIASEAGRTKRCYGKRCELIHTSCGGSCRG